MRTEALFGAVVLIALILWMEGCQMNHTPSTNFLGDGYLLDSATARDLFNEIRDLPIVDAHNHADIVEIVENHPWSDIWEVEGATDHYVWELMRKRDVPEEKITGDAPNREKWQALAEVFPRFVGNPTYEWIHLDLKRRFGIEEIIRPETANSIWMQTQAKLAKPEMRPQELLRAMNIEIMCTTDDPTVQLPYHERAREEIEHVRILPTWRPDKTMNIEKETWRPFLKRLAEETGIDTTTLEGLEKALQATHDYFQKLGCVVSDHGLTEPYAHHVDPGRASRIHRKVLEGGTPTDVETRDYHAYMLRLFGRMNAVSRWVMQLHIGAVRDYREVLFQTLGPDTGSDISDQRIDIVSNLRPLLNAFDRKLKIVLYCVDPTHLPTLVTIARAFPNVSIGAPWWWNDSPYGIETHLEYMATVDLLANHAGMVTDSRKLISFGSRTELFRRVLCNVVGKMVERGQMPIEEALELVRQIADERPRELFFAGASTSSD
jgi:glucuronate isomerase